MSNLYYEFDEFCKERGLILNKEEASAIQSFFSFYKDSNNVIQIIIMQNRYRKARLSVLLAIYLSMSMDSLLLYAPEKMKVDYLPQLLDLDKKGFESVAFANMAEIFGVYKSDNKYKLIIFYYILRVQTF